MARGVYARRVDSNQNEIVALMRDLGASVLILSAVGKGCPDILAGIRGRNILIEIKDGNKPPSARKLTEDEKRFHDEWNGQVCVIKDVTEAIALINRLNFDK